MKNKEKILTALGNKEFIKLINNCNKFEVISRDIQYKEGILEILEIKKQIDIILINKKLPGKIKYNELINKIKKINSKIKIIIINKKKDILDFINNNSLKEINTFIGTGGVGKSTIISMIIKKSKEKTMIIDRRYEDKSLLILFDIKNKSKKIIKINENCYFYNNIINEKEIEQMKNKYEKILIEIHNVKKEIKLLEKSNNIFLVLESNLLSIYKSKEIIKILKNNGVKKEKINIIINNKKTEKIERNIIKRIFCEYKIINFKKIKGEKKWIYTLITQKR